MFIYVNDCIYCTTTNLMFRKMYIFTWYDPSSVVLYYKYLQSWKFTWRQSALLLIRNISYILLDLLDPSSYTYKKRVNLHPSPEVSFQIFMLPTIFGTLDFSITSIHPGRLTWNLQITHEKKGKWSSRHPWGHVPAVHLPGCSGVPPIPKPLLPVAVTHTPQGGVSLPFVSRRSQVVWEAQSWDAIAIARIQRMEATWLGGRNGYSYTGKHTRTFTSWWFQIYFFQFSPRSVGKMNPFRRIFFKWVGSTTN